MGLENKLKKEYDSADITVAKSCDHPEVYVIDYHVAHDETTNFDLRLIGYCPQCEKPAIEDAKDYKKVDIMKPFTHRNVPYIGLLYKRMGDYND